MSYITIDQVSKCYSENTVLDHISLLVKNGELVTLLGQSGCGKSTLLRAIAGLTEVDEGSIFIDGKEVTNLAPRHRQVGMVFQSYALFPNMTVFNNIAFGLRMKKMNSRSIKQEVQNMIDLTHLNGKEDAYPHQLSGGQQQRVALARSLVMKPKVLLLDEPLSALDAQIRKSLQQELKRVQKELEITTIFVTHDQDEAMTLSDRIFIMNEGQIIQSGTPTEIYTHPASSFIARFIGNYNVFSCKDFQQMTGNTEFDGFEVAIRPEVIQLSNVDESSMKNKEHYWVLQGRIKDRSMIGNVLRYEIETAKTNVCVDYLHHNVPSFVNGDQVLIHLPKKDCISI
ncbi:ABC transporter ATP-binding protein [Melghirimyces algeriensis]|uniref:Carnitine transport ATP-binding protein OpuCA n=1 Tax=Melghirimyces algeriensis TaxID=910412 RepID=A0A521BQ84_9BACL|nr:ABC transporter ATP-binding protein [Melghirimyces algeriensis]SMO49322.1 putative spermidine/putrescine transport system ATP-binding protein [Melghirimyces algeriensis]